MSSPLGNSNKIILMAKTFKQMLNSQNSEYSQEDFSLVLENLCKKQISLAITVLGRSICMICNSVINDKNYRNLPCPCYQSVHNSCWKEKAQTDLICSICNQKISQEFRFESKITKQSESRENSNEEKEKSESHSEEEEEEKQSDSENIDENQELNFDYSLDEKCLDKALEIQNNKHITSPQLETEIKSICQSFKEHKLLLILIGETSAGKTTLINRILSYDSKANSFDKPFYNLLPSRAEENTTFLWIIESSEDKFIWVQTSLEEKKKFQVSEVDSLKNYLKEIDVKQMELLQQMKSQSKEGEFLKNRKSLTIKLPWLDPKLKILDFPGLSSEITLNELQKMITNNIAYFIYMKDLYAPETLKESVIKLVEKNKNNVLEPKFFSLIFTKKDKFFKLEEADIAGTLKPENLIYAEKTKRLINVLDKTEEFLQDKEVLIKRVDFFNLLFMDTDGKECHFFQKFIQHLNSIRNVILYHTRPFIFLSSLVEIADKHFQQKSKEAKAMVTPQVAMRISHLKEKLNEKYDKKLKKFFNNMENPKICEQKESEFYEKIKTLIQETIEVEGKKDMKWNKSNFIELIMKVAGEDILKILEKTFQSIFRPLFRQFLEEVITFLGEQQFEDIMNINAQKIFQKGYNWDENEKLIFATMLGGVLSGGVAVAANVGIRLGLIVGEALIPGAGWVMAVFSVGTLIWGAKDKLGMFSNKNCWEDIMKLIIKFIKEKQKNMKEKLLKDAENIFHNIYEKIINSKELPNELKKCKRTIWEFRDSLKKQKNMDGEEDIDSKIIWKKVRIEQLLFNKDLKEHIQNMLQLKIGK